MLQFFSLHGIDFEGKDGIARCGCKNPNCDKPGKHPIPFWRTVGPDNKAGPMGGVGIPTGSINGFFVVDCDVRPEKGLDGVAALEALALAAGGEIPETASVETPTGGAHFYFKVPKDVVIYCSTGKLAPGIDIKGEGGFAVGPGSPHRNGGFYGVAPTIDPVDAPVWLLERLALLQKELKARNSEGPSVPLPELSAEESSRRQVYAIEEILEKAEPAISGENGSNRLLEVCCRLIRLELPTNILVSLIEDFYNPRCEPPWSEEEIRHKLEAADRKVERARGFPSPGLFARMAGIVSEAEAEPLREANPEHEYSYQPGDRHEGDRVPVDFVELQADLYSHEKWAGVLAYDEFRDRVVAVNPPFKMDAETPSGLSDADVNNTRGWFEYHGKRGRPADVKAALELVARRRPFHPVRNYLHSLKWDGKPRLDTVLSTYFGAAENEYTRAIGVRWFISLGARVMRPGCQSDCTLILEGAQGRGKTSAYRALMHDPLWYAESSAGVESKDFYENLRGIWLFGFDELDSLHRSSLTRVKTELTSVKDHYRRAYGHFTVDYPRQCGFCGTTNSSEYLNDLTGNRRFWPVAVLRDIVISKIIRDRDQLWAEASMRFQAGEAWHVNTPELRALCEAEQADRTHVDPWESIVAHWLADPTKVSLEPLAALTTGSAFGGGLRPVDASKGLTTATVLERALGKEAAQLTNADAQRVAGILRRLGWTARKVRVAGNPMRHYYPATPGNTPDGK